MYLKLAARQNQENGPTTKVTGSPRVLASDLLGKRMLLPMASKITNMLFIGKSFGHHMWSMEERLFLLYLL